MALRGTITAARQLLRCPVIPGLLGIVLCGIAAHSLADPRFGSAVGRDRIAIYDFASHVTFARAFWHGEAGYSVESHLRSTRRLTGEPVPYALPFGYSPTMLWILAPFSLLPTVWAFLAWTAFGAAGAWWMLRRYDSLPMAAVLVSPAALACFLLGQTAVLTAAGLLMLMSRDLERRRKGEESPRAEWVDVA